MFTVGHSVTRNLDNVLIWNGIHHKSKPSGGTEHYAWPDPGYYNRVKQELLMKGVTFANQSEKDYEIDLVVNRTNSVSAN